MGPRYLIDTNIVSEPLSKQPNEAVENWLKENAARSYLSTITVEEMTRGVTRLPDGRKKRVLSKAIEASFSSFGDRIIPFDIEQARVCGRLEGESEARGVNFDLEDYMIAAAAKANSLTVVTRNEKHFRKLDVPVLNPFEEI